MREGLVHIYCGDGKGKTTAAVGLAVRAVGSGKKALFIQYLKGRSSSEISLLEKLPNLMVLRAQTMKKFTCDMTAGERAAVFEANNDLLKEAFRQAAEGDCDFLVLDEALGACDTGLLDEDKLLEFIQDKPAELEVVLTGRDPSECLLAVADYVTEMKKIKHPFDKGAVARKGVEF